MANLYLDSSILSKNKFTSVPYPMEQVSSYRITLLYKIKPFIASNLIHFR